MEIRKFRTESQAVPSTKMQNPTEGVMSPNKLEDFVVEMLLERLKDEYAAHYFYRASANWCRSKNYKKAAAFFDEESSSELEHSKKVQNYLTDWNVDFQIPRAETEHEFESLINIINGAYQMELSLLKAYNQTSSEVLVKDMTTFDFLQELRQGQNQSVIEYSDLLNALNLVDYNDKFQILYFEQTYF